MVDAFSRLVAALPLVFAQDGAAQGSPFNMLPVFVVIGVLFYLMLVRPQRKEQQTRQSMLESLKKNDRVVTVGGIYGVVTNIRKELDQVSLTVDEKGGTVIRVTLASIARVVRDEPTGEKTENTSK
jgi:preprotein translocase subunit YajC